MSERGIPRLSWVVPRDPARRVRRYVCSALLAVVLTWLVAIALIVLSNPLYTSRWTMVLPDRSEATSIAVSDIGNASFNQSSPFGNSAQNPLLTYQQFSTSAVVLARAAEIAGLDVNDFKAPRIKLIPLTPLMEFQISGADPTQAQAKAHALITALLETLDGLRQDELQRRDVHRHQALAAYSDHLDESRAAVLAHQSATKVVTTRQFDVLAENLEARRKSLVEETAEQQRLDAYLRTLYKGVGMSERDARAAVRLQAREDLKQLLRKLADQLLVVSDKQARYGRQHPEVIAARATLDAMETTLMAEVELVFKLSRAALRDIALLSTGQETGAVLRQIVQTSAELAGLEAKVKTLAQSVIELDERLQSEARSAAQLADLERDHAIAEAVFTSALGRISTEKFDVLAVYPLLQTFAQPSLPNVQDPRKMLFLIAGACGITVCIFVALTLIWLREPLWLRLTQST